MKNFNFNKLIIINPKPIFPNDKILATSVGAKDINSTRHQQIQKEAALQVPSQLILCSAASFSWHRA